MPIVKRSNITLLCLWCWDYEPTNEPNSRYEVPRATFEMLCLTTTRVFKVTASFLAPPRGEGHCFLGRVAQKFKPPSFPDQRFTDMKYKYCGQTIVYSTYVYSWWQELPNVPRLLNYSRKLVANINFQAFVVFFFLLLLLLLWVHQDLNSRLVPVPLPS